VIDDAATGGPAAEIKGFARGKIGADEFDFLAVAEGERRATPLVMRKRGAVVSG